MEIDNDAIKREFIIEAEEQLASIEEALVTLEEHPENAEVLQTVFRMAHTFKGNASIVGLNGVAAFAHSLEDILERLRDHTLTPSGELVTLLLKAVDALRKMVPAALAGKEEPQPAHQALVDWLERKNNPKPQAKEPAVAEPPPTSLEAGAGNTRSSVDNRLKTLRVDIRRLDRILNLTGELVIAHGRVAALLERAQGKDDLLALEAHQEASRLLLELQEHVMQVRMVQVGPTFRQHARSVRDLADACGKQARLVVEGEEVEVDTALIEHIRDPLTHMIRNAIDHGLETPENRKKLNKDPCGTIYLSARHDGGYVVVEVRDDGQGLHREKIIQRAHTALGIPNPEEMSDQDLFRLIFEPGFSTAETITELSGRGIGMHVVRRNVEALRGTVSIASEFGKGSTISLRLPLTLAIIEGFAVGCENETYIIPLHAINECVELPGNSQVQPNGCGVINLRGEALPYMSLRKVFGTPGEPPTRQSIVVVQHDGGHAGLAVDCLYGEQQTVIKPLGKVFQGLTGISGSAILGSGQVALILDVPGLLREILRQDTHFSNRRAGSDLEMRNVP